MTKTDIVKIASEATELPQTVVSKVLDEFINIITDEVSSGGEVQLIGFGTFSAKKRAARTGMNPQTKEPIEIPEMVVPHFKPGKKFKEAVNED